MLLEKERWRTHPVMLEVSTPHVQAAGNCQCTGHLGKNIAGDLHMKHLNRKCKGSIGGLEATVTECATYYTCGKVP